MTTYLVMRAAHILTEEEKDMYGWVLVGEVDAHSSQRAVETWLRSLDNPPEDGVYVAIPERSFREYRGSITTHQTITVRPADATA